MLPSGKNGFLLTLQSPWAFLQIVVTTADQEPPLQPALWTPSLQGVLGKLSWFQGLISEAGGPH